MCFMESVKKHYVAKCLTAISETLKLATDMLLFRCFPLIKTKKKQESGHHVGGLVAKNISIFC